MLIQHKIAGINFSTEANTDLQNSQWEFLKKFEIERLVEGNVFHFIQRVEEECLNMPALDNKDRERILKFRIQADLGYGSFIIPPFFQTQNSVSDNVGKSSYGRDPMDLPLLHSQMVRERLEACMDYPEQVRLLLHLFSVEIYDYRLQRIDVFYHPDVQWVLDEYPLENGLRRMFTSFLPSFSCVMLLSSGFILSNLDCVFFGSDGGGKSTVVKNHFEGDVLSDDQNIVRKEGGVFKAYSTPWGHINSSPKSAPLGGLFFLEKAQEFDLISTKPYEIFEFIWQEHMQMWNGLPKNLRVEAFKILAEICYHTPCYRMKFPKTFVDWDAIDTVLGN